MSSSFFEAVNARHGLGLAAGALSSFFWTVTYALVLRRGAADRTFGMPLVALGANLAWELHFLVVTLAHGVHDARLAMLLPWTLLDVGIVVQCFRHGARDFTNPLVVRHFRVGLTGILVLAAAVLVAFVHEMRDAIGWYTAFGQNLMMSALFVAMLLRRNGVEGQSLAIAVAKLFGTFFAFVLAVFWSPPTLHEHWASLLPDRYTPVAPLLVVLYAVTFVLDVTYAALVFHTCRARGVDPWRLRDAQTGQPRDRGLVTA